MASDLHSALVRRACAWLRNTERCSVVFAEFAGPVPEFPDAIGWRRLTAWRSILVEVKTSRADFLRDREKVSRQLCGMGQQRWYLTPPGLLRADDLPEGWGLLESTGRPRSPTRRVVEAPELGFSGERAQWEIAVLVAAVRRHEVGVAWLPDEYRFAPAREEDPRG